MDWNIVITTIFASSTSAIMLVILGFVGRNIFSQLLSQDIEKFKSDLQKTPPLISGSTTPQ
jgi:hypothetical protein